MNKNNVIFKGNQKGITVLLDNTIPFDELTTTLLTKVKDAKNFFSGINIPISIKGRELSETEETEILNIISNESGIIISFVDNMPTINYDNTDKSNKANDNNSKKNDTNPQENMSKYAFSPQSNLSFFHKGSIRSGQKIDFNGSVVIIGDVNPGGQIFAEGNIIVLGKLRGLAHAGCKGSSECFISALHMAPTQLIIGDCLAMFPNDARDMSPEYAYVKNNQIFVEPLINI